jgi:hypothetical protein
MSKYQHYDDSADEIMDQPEGEDRYEVGYKKPPKSTQFTKGKSGNPSGRPKKQTSHPEIFQDTINGTVTMIENGHRSEVRKIEAIYQAMVNKAMKGDIRAAAQVLALADKFKLSEPEEQKITSITWTVIDHKGNIIPELSR